MTTKSGDGRVSGLNEETAQEKQNEITIVSRETKFNSSFLITAHSSLLIRLLTTSN